MAFNSRILLLWLMLLQATWNICASDLDVVRERRFSNIVGTIVNATLIPNWLSTLGPDGKWPDDEIDYTSGCRAQAANWPAEVHWIRVLTLSAGWHGGLPDALQFVNDSDVRSAISLALNFWFNHDFQNPSCIDSGGSTACPCTTPGLWNTNWFANIILVPALVGQSCLLLGDSLSASELDGCTRVTGRTYRTFQTGIKGVGPITGSNALDIASIGLDEGLLLSNATQVAAAYTTAHSEMVIQNTVRADGIRADGSFGQHAGILYNGNYGKDFANDVLKFELGSGGTQFQASNAQMSAFETLIDGDQWMMFLNVATGVLHWDFSVLGRFIGLAVADDQATAGIKINVTQLGELGQLWGSDTLTQISSNLSVNTTDANIGSLLGNRMFYANDYMVQRNQGYVTTLKMFSRRTQNSECTNTQDPFGLHLSDGAVHTYLVGDEYEDIAAAWDWNLIPGITVDYGATPLNCASTQRSGTHSFVGGASDGMRGVAAMHYETPISKTLSWRKSWFFLDNDVQFVLVARIKSTTQAPVFSVLDQRKHTGDVFLDGVVRDIGNYTGVGTLWHGGVGYAFNVSNLAASLSFQVGNRTGSWSAIGTSTQGLANVDLFSAWLSHDDPSVPISYAVYPATTLSTFQKKAQASSIQILQNDGFVSAIVDITNQIAMIVFWERSGGQIIIPSTNGSAGLIVMSSGNANAIISLMSWSLTLADPTQTLQSITFNITVTDGPSPVGWGNNTSKVLNITLPAGGLAGNSVTKSLVTSVAAKSTNSNATGASTSGVPRNMEKKRELAAVVVIGVLWLQHF